MPSFMHSAALLGMALLQSVHAHTSVSKMIQNGNDVGAVCLRKHTGGPSPISDLQSQEMACGWGSAKPAKSKCPVSPGDKIGLYYGDESHHLSASHKGPASVMMRKVDDAATAQGPGDGWFRVWFHGHENGQWGTETMMQDGTIDFVIPEGLAGGDYFIRGELVAMHLKGRPQFFVSCLQVTLSGSGSGSPETVSIPGNYVDINSESMQWDRKVTEGFPYYGPPVFGSGESPESSGMSGNGTSTTTGGSDSEDHSAHGGGSSTTDSTGSGYGSGSDSGSSSSSTRPSKTTSAPSRTPTSSRNSNGGSGRGSNDRNRNNSNNRNRGGDSNKSYDKRDAPGRHCDEEDATSSTITPTPTPVGRYVRRAIL